jgi:zinc D-Ala-D-Ala carboxypeptidase
MNKKIGNKKKTNKKRNNKIKLIIIRTTLFTIIVATIIIFLEKNTEDIQAVTALAPINSGDAVNSYNSIYENVYYYDSRNEQRYINYQSLNSTLSVEEVVWRTNSSLDKEFYSEINEIENTEVELLLVNKYNKLPDNYVPKNLEMLPSGQYLQHNTKIAFEQIKQDAKKKGYIINDASGYRSISYQVELYNFYMQTNSQKVSDTFSARAGHSEHNTGQAIDISGSFGDILEFEYTKEFKWIKENAYKYGFIIRYPKGYENITGYKYEPWHIRYVGVEIATDMREKNINTLEEYYAKFISYIK